MLGQTSWVCCPLQKQWWRKIWSVPFWDRRRCPYFSVVRCGFSSFTWLGWRAHHRAGLIEVVNAPGTAIFEPQLDICGFHLATTSMVNNYGHLDTRNKARKSVRLWEKNRELMGSETWKKPNRNKLAEEGSEHSFAHVETGLSKLTIIKQSLTPQRRQFSNLHADSWCRDMQSHPKQTGANCFVVRKTWWSMEITGY